MFKVEEGTRYFLNRLTFAGNTTTRDSVIRREMRLVEGGVFNMESLKFSIRRLNQLGYFKPLESEDSVKIEKTPNAEGKVDVRLKFEEQNRNQLSFGAGISQFEGFFGQLGFQTSNFMGRGETLSISAQKGSQARNYQLAFTEPFLFGRPITAGIDVYSRQVNYLFQFTQGSTGSNILFGFPIKSWSRFFIGYSLEKVSVSNIADIYNNPTVLDGNPLLRESLLIDSGGKRIISKISPSLTYNTVNEPIFPTSGTKYIAALDIAGLGGDTSLPARPPRRDVASARPRAPRSASAYESEQTTGPTATPRRCPSSRSSSWAASTASADSTCAASAPGTEVGTGAGWQQDAAVQRGGHDQRWRTRAPGVLLRRRTGPRHRAELRVEGNDFRDGAAHAAAAQRSPGAAGFADAARSKAPSTPTQRAIGRTYAFKTSLGSEVRFFMPVLNVPFRLIFAYNPQRGNIFNNNLLRQQEFTFRFAVGTTFVMPDLKVGLRVEDGSLDPATSGPTDERQ